MIRKNAYVIYLDYFKEESVSQKEYMYEMISEVILLAHKFCPNSPSSKNMRGTASSVYNSTIATNDSNIFKVDYNTNSPLCTFLFPKTLNWRQ